MKQAITIRQTTQPEVLTGETMNKFAGFLDVSTLTVKAYCSGLKMFARYLSNAGIKNPQRDDVLSFKNSMLEHGRKPSTVALYLTACRRFFSWTEAEGIYPNVAVGVKAPKLSKWHKKDCFTGLQLKGILTGIDRSSVEGLRNYAVMALMTAGGLRTVEVIRANVEDLRTVAGVPVLYVQGKGRTEKADFIKLPSQVEMAIREYLSARGHVKDTAPLFASESRRNKGGRLTTRTISGVAKHIMVDAGYNSRRLTAHSLRHSAITLALMGGRELADVQAFARHSNINTTMIYNHAVNRINSLCEDTIANAIF